MALRISSGSAKNIKLNTPEIEGFRAVQEIAKQCIIAVLADKTIGAKCLDLYAGSGNLGLEAISRGAASCDFVDENYEAKTVLLENIAKCKFDEQARVFHANAVKFVAKTQETYDIIFVDPFYEDTAHKFLLQNLEKILNPEGIIIFLHGTNLNISDVISGTKLKVTTERKFGMSILSFLTH